MSTAVARGKPSIIVSKTQQVQFTQSNFFITVYKQPVLRSLQRCETTSSMDERRKQVSKRALITSWIQNCPFHCETFTYQHNLRIFYTDKVSCNTNIRRPQTKPRNKLSVWRPSNLVILSRATPAVPTQTFFWLRINTVLVGKILLLFHQKTALRCILILFHVKMK